MVLFFNHAIIKTIQPKTEKRPIFVCMKKTPQRYTITAALPYANGPVHIGHMAGVYIPADIYARYLRLCGKDALFICGSDEHGVPITIRAQQEGLSPQQVVDKYHQIIKHSFEDFGISFDIYSRTSSKIHHQTASDFFKKLYTDGVFEEKTTEQYYDEKSKQFLADRYIKGTCPNCQNPEAYGDQCEKCGSTLSPQELINPYSALSGAKPVLKETHHWYLPLNQFESWLKNWILEEHTDWKTNVYGQCKSWLDQGLKPRAVTRDLDWGVPVPLTDAKGKVLYVWFDAPIGYISATKEWAEDKSKNKRGENWETYWKDPETKLVHFIGKDNIVFHCIIFPTMLKVHGEYILPDSVPANEFLNLEGNKISTSRNWAVWLHDYLVDFPNQQDTLRYVLTANAPETKDNDFTWKDFQARNNNELVAILGNFVNRTLTLIQKYYNGVIPETDESKIINGLATLNVDNHLKKISDLIEHYKFREAIQTMMDLARSGNKFLADEEPWKKIKTDPELVKNVLTISAQLCANLALGMAPFLPTASAALYKMLNIEPLKWNEGGEKIILKSNHQVNEPHLLFQKIEDDAINHQIQKLEKRKMENTIKTETIASNKETSISFDDFSKLDIRTATILEAEKIPDTAKLLKLKVDTGFDQRTIVSGIAEFFDPEKIIGKQICVLANLAPRKIKGIESQGMVLMAENKDGKLYFVQPEEPILNGSKIS